MHTTITITTLMITVDALQNLLCGGYSLTAWLAVSPVCLFVVLFASVVIFIALSTHLTIDPGTP